ncbi:MAG: extracellular solute-binding protein [Azoarcus sp.]|jgi:sn-glycerol 3-phosphate transport system substrate-binding protein|nr:extracellular solute-binding protein [Azoarcus sp.]
MCKMVRLCCSVVSMALTASVFAAPAPVKETIAQRIEIFQQLPARRAAALRGLIERFNAQNKAYQVALVEHDWHAQKTPHLLILSGDGEEAFLAGKPRFRPLHVVMKEAGAALQTLRPSAAMSSTPVDAKGLLRALPIGMSTPVLYVNRDALRRAGLDPDHARLSTWRDLQNTLAQLADSGSTCPYTVAEPGRVMVENQSAWHNVPVALVRNRKAQPAFNGFFQVRHVAQMASWVRARYLHVFANRAEAEQRFVSGECAMIAAPSDSWVDFRRQEGFDVAVTRLPYYDDLPGAPQNTLADGPSLWVSAGKKAIEYKGVASFVRFWLQAENQAAWQRETGYLPLNRAGLLAARSDLPENDVDNTGNDVDNIQVAVDQLTLKPATSVSAAQAVVGRETVRQVLDEELAAVWADHKATKAALDNAVARLAPGK